VVLLPVTTDDARSFFRLAPPGYAEDAELNSLELLPILLGGHSASFTRLSNVTGIDSTITTSLSNVSETVKKITITAVKSQLPFHRLEEATVLFPKHGPLLLRFDLRKAFVIELH
jgi:hypothetical protein